MNTYLDRILSNLSDDFYFYENHPEEWGNVEKKENYLVCQVTSPANYFHLLRSQVTNDYRKPLFLFNNESVILE